MRFPFLSIKKAQAICSALFLFSLAILAITDSWWPGIMLAIGLPLALRQYFLKRTYDMAITLVVFIGTFITVQYDLNWRVFLPILFCLGAFYILLREFLGSSEENQEDSDKK